MKRYSHDLSFIHSLSLDMGYLVPIACIDVLPGDTFINSCNMLTRVSPLAKPVMHPVEIRVHNWFVPNRILWSGWEDFIVGNEDALTYPTWTIANSANAVLPDHLGIEPLVGSTVDALPIYAYNRIFNEWYRDQDLVAERNQWDGTLAQIAWGKDYFTTARPNPQQGAAVEVNFSGGFAPVDGIYGNATPSTQDLVFSDGTAGPTSAPVRGLFGLRDGGSDPGYGEIYANLSEATGGIDINDLRQAISLQRIAEAREFFGSRYADYLRWYGISPSDGRLQRPEYLGGGKQMIQFSEVLSTAEGTNTGVGDLFGHGIAGVRQRPIRKMFEEHGWFLSLMSVRPAGIYQRGIPRRFNRREPTDWWHRELELLPWQEVKAKEIFADAGDSQIFGYAPRYDEYRETPSYVSGTFRGGTEEDYTLARDFSSLPNLNASFVTCDPSDRIYQDTSQPQLLCTARVGVKAKRLVAANSRISSRAGL